MELYIHDIFVRLSYLKSRLISSCTAFVLFILAFSSIDTYGQPFADSKGRDFWLTFMPNYHNSYSYTDEIIRRSDSLYIFITSDKPTEVRIDYNDKYGNPYNDTIRIINTGDVYTYKLCYMEFELAGYNKSGATTQYYQNDAEKISNLSFHITSDEDINVYAHNQAITTSEAMMIFPTDALGREYFVMAYNSNDIDYANSGAFSATPSQFAIVASEDSTFVKITPSSPTQYRGSAVQNIKMNKGDVYLVQAALPLTYSNYDLTGSEIIATKPVAVFGGQQRTMLPVDMTGGSPSRDYLIEQLPPVNTWGKSVFLTPYLQLPDMTAETQDIYRILAAYDDIEVYYDNNYVTTLNKGEYYEDVLNKAGTIFATGPVLVAQYKRTSQSNSSGTGFLPPGDPFMMIIPPKEQFMKFYRVINTQAYETYAIYDTYPDSIKYDYTKVYDYQYITIIAPDTSLNTVKIDNKQVLGAVFSKIPGSGYSYANVRVTDGVHTVEADVPIGIYIYGYGGANSYGYVGGLSFAPFDYKKPVLSYNINCYELIGSLTDTLQYDTGISEFKNIPDSAQNVTVNIDNFSPLQTQIGIKASLVNNRYDGKFSLSSIDGYKNKALYNIEIPGFTVGVKDANPKEAVMRYSYETRIEKEFCFDIPVINYGKFKQVISSIRLKNNVFELRNFDFNELLAGNERTLAVCFNPLLKGIYTDTLVIENDCGTWELAIITIEGKNDENPPFINISSDSCSLDYLITVTDSLPTDYGIKSITYNELVNCTVNPVSQESKVGIIALRVNDPYYDAIYDITVEDAFGLITNIRDTIQGYTLSIKYEEDIRELDFRTATVGARICDSVKLHNYGLLPLVFNDAYVFDNTLYSVPQSQFPIVINPGEDRYLQVCLRAQGYTNQEIFDSLRLDYNCLNMVIPFTGIAGYIENDTKTRCNIPIKIITTNIPAGYFLEQNIPNPVTGVETKVIFGLPEAGNAEISVWDLKGQELIKSELYYYQPGVYEIELNTNILPSSVYIYILKTGKVKIARLFVVSK